MNDIVIWGDVLFFIDFTMDYLSLDFCCRVMKIRVKLPVLCASAAMGAAVGVGLTAVGGSTVISVPVFLFTAVLVCMTVLPVRTWTGTVLPKTVCLFLITEAALGGIMTVLYGILDRILPKPVSHGSGGISGFLLSAAAAWGILSLLLRMLAGRSSADRTGTVTVRVGEKEDSLPCLFDTGNLAREPISGLPVVFLPSSSAGNFGIRLNSLASGTMPGSRLIPVSTVSGNCLLWGIRPDFLCFRTPAKRIADGYVVFSDQMSGGEEKRRYAIAPSA